MQPEKVTFLLLSFVTIAILSHWHWITFCCTLNKDSVQNCTFTEQRSSRVVKKPASWCQYVEHHRIDRPHHPCPLQTSDSSTVKCQELETTLLKLLNQNVRSSCELCAARRRRRGAQFLTTHHPPLRDQIKSRIDIIKAVWFFAPCLLFPIIWVVFSFTQLHCDLVKEIWTYLQE